MFIESAEMVKIINEVLKETAALERIGQLKHGGYTVINREIDKASGNIIYVVKIDEAGAEMPPEYVEYKRIEIALYLLF